MKKKTMVVAAAVLLMTVGLGFGWLGRPVAEVIAVQRGTAVSAVYGTVKVTPAVRMLVRARNTGTVRLAQTSAAADIIAGVEVQKGWVLARIESPELDRDLIKAEADLKAGEERAQLGPPSLQGLKTAESALARLEKLAQLHDAPPSEVEKARGEAQTLRERVKSEQLEIDRTVTALREQTGALRDRKAHCDVKAPMDGVLATVNVVSGDLVTDGAPLFLICTRSYFLEGQVNEEDVGSLKKQMKAVVRLYSYPQKDFSATLTDIVPAGENQRYTVRLAFETPPDNLMAGMTGEMNIILGRREGSLVVPTRALMSDRVWVVSGGVVQRRAVKTGLRSLERTEIVDGLGEGELVVTEDHDAFHEGQWVKTMPVNR
jgi:RND family efflux transporter MFP subunit